MTSVRVLLHGAIDYAGLFPPAGLAMTAAVENYRTYREGSEAWALGRFVVPLARAGETGLPPETLSVVSAGRETAGTIEYLEQPVHLLAEVKGRGARAKVRTGGITPDLFPSPEALTTFLLACARLQLPFKATAGLHHAVRSLQKLTYEPDSASATMHGFLNVLLAASLAWHGGTHDEVRATLEETDAAAFQFDDAGVAWHDQRLSNEELARARSEFMAGFGSCSFEEPLRELREMGLV